MTWKRNKIYIKSSFSRCKSLKPLIPSTAQQWRRIKHEVPYPWIDSICPCLRALLDAFFSKIRLLFWPARLVISPFHLQDEDKGGRKEEKDKSGNLKWYSQIINPSIHTYIHPIHLFVPLHLTNIQYDPPLFNPIHSSSSSQPINPHRVPITTTEKLQSVSRKHVKALKRKKREAKE